MKIRMNAQTVGADLLGFVDASGNYQRTGLRDAYERGGEVAILDLESANKNMQALISLLVDDVSLLFPDGRKVRKSPDFSLTMVKEEPKAPRRKKAEVKMA